MSWSLGEIKVLSVKAARGSGLPWGLAEEAGYAVHWLEARGGPGVEALSQYLGQRDIRGAKPVRSPLHVGASICDGIVAKGGVLGEVRTPILLVPFIAKSITEGSVKLECGDSGFIVSKDGFKAPDSMDAMLVLRTPCRLMASDQPVIASGKQTRVFDEKADYVATLAKFAHRTYAPATEESRLAGAGAGLSDND